jgi:phosphatidylserine/phosphatidylglycerophosphate/cardiolipin synthase-like enzyme
VKHWLIACALALAMPAQAIELPATGTVEVLFTPWDDAEGALIRAIDGARRDIHVQAFLLTSRNLARALLAARQRGIAVRLLADREMLAKGQNSRVPELHAAGIEVRLETRYASAHNKILLIDAEGTDPVVITGSYNFTFSAQARNAENLLILRGNPALARAYLNNWRRHRDEATPYVAGLGKRVRPAACSSISGLTCNSRRCCGRSRRCCFVSEPRGLPTTASVSAACVPGFRIAGFCR